MPDFTPAPINPIATIAALEGLDIRVGSIERVEDVPRSERLVKLTVNFGNHSRTILAGLKKERENPRAIEGRQALFVVNVERAKWPASFPKACYLISGTRTASHRYFLFRSDPFRTALAPARLYAGPCSRKLHFPPESF
jgi:hypothetical protein